MIAQKNNIVISRGKNKIMLCTSKKTVGTCSTIKNYPVGKRYKKIDVFFWSLQLLGWLKADGISPGLGSHLVKPRCSVSASSVIFFFFIYLLFYILNVIIPVMLSSPRTVTLFVWRALWELEKPGGHFTVTIPSNVSLFLLAA